MNYKYLFWLITGIIIGYIFQINNLEGFENLTGCNDNRRLTINASGVYNDEGLAQTDPECDKTFKIKIHDFIINEDPVEVTRLLMYSRYNYINKIYNSTFYERDRGLKKIIYISLDDSKPEGSRRNSYYKMILEFTYGIVNSYNVYLYDYNRLLEDAGINPIYKMRGKPDIDLTFSRVPQRLAWDNYHGMQGHHYHGCTPPNRGSMGVPYEERWRPSCNRERASFDASSLLPGSRNRYTPLRVPLDLVYLDIHPQSHEGGIIYHQQRMVEWRQDYRQWRQQDRQARNVALGLALPPLGPAAEPWTQTQLSTNQAEFTDYKLLSEFTESGDHYMAGGEGGSNPIILPSQELWDTENIWVLENTTDQGKYLISGFLIKLTSSGIFYLWHNYINDAGLQYTLKYNTEDGTIDPTTASWGGWPEGGICPICGNIQSNSDFASDSSGISFQDVRMQASQQWFGTVEVNTASADADVAVDADVSCTSFESGVGYPEGCILPITANNSPYLKIISNTFIEDFKSVFTLNDKQNPNIYIKLEIIPDNTIRLTKDKIKSMIYNGLIEP